MKGCRYGQISMEQLMILSIAILLLIYSATTVYKHVNDDKEKDAAMAAEIGDTLTDQIMTSMKQGQGWTTLQVDVPPGMISIEATGQGELSMRFSDGTEHVVWLPKGVNVFNQDNGLDVFPGRNKIRITNQGAYVCVSDADGVCEENRCIDDDEDGYYKNCDERDLDDDYNYSYPGAPEICDGLDNDFDSKIDEEYFDGEPDLWYNENVMEQCWHDRYELEGVMQHMRGYPMQTADCQDVPQDLQELEISWEKCSDCDDNHVLRNPGQEEQCDEEDWDCDGGYYTQGNQPIYADCEDLYPAGTQCAAIQDQVECVSGNWGDYVCEDWNGFEQVESTCEDDIDNDCDGLIDLEDSDCADMIFSLNFEQEYTAQAMTTTGFEDREPMEAIENCELMQGMGILGSIGLFYHENPGLKYSIDTESFNIVEGSIVFWIRDKDSLLELSGAKLLDVKSGSPLEDTFSIRVDGGQLITVIDDYEWQTGESPDFDEYTMIGYTYEEFGTDGVSQILYVNGQEAGYDNKDNIEMHTNPKQLLLADIDKEGLGPYFDHLLISHNPLYETEMQAIYNNIMSDCNVPPGTCTRERGFINPNECIDPNDAEMVTEALQGNIPLDPCMDVSGPSGSPDGCKIDQSDVEWLEQNLEACSQPPYDTCVFPGADDCDYTENPPLMCTGTPDWELLTGCNNCNYECPEGFDCIPNGLCIQELPESCWNGVLDQWESDTGNGATIPDCGHPDSGCILCELGRTCPEGGDEYCEEDLCCECPGDNLCGIGGSPAIFKPLPTCPDCPTGGTQI